MSDIWNPYPEEDPAVEDLIMQMVMGGWQPYGQQMNVPYQKDVMGSSTDPTRAWKSQDTILKSQKSLMGFSPIEEFAGPQPQLWVPGTEQLAEEVAGDDIGQQLLERLDAGEGIINLQKQITDAMYTEEDGGPTPERPMSPQQADVYLDWLKRYSKARSEDYIKLAQPGTVTDPAEMDVMGDLPTDEALNFNEDDYIRRLTEGGAFGAGDRNRSFTPQQRGANKPVNRDFPSTMAPQGIADRVRGMVRGVTQRRSPTQMSQGRSTRGRGPLTDAMDRGYKQLEGKYRQDARQAQATSRRPSLAKERAYRAIVAYRLSHGLPPT